MTLLLGESKNTSLFHLTEAVVNALQHSSPLKTEKHKIWLITCHFNSFHPCICKVGQEPVTGRQGACPLFPSSIFQTARFLPSLIQPSGRAGPHCRIRSCAQVLALRRRCRRTMSYLPGCLVQIANSWEVGNAQSTTSLRALSPEKPRLWCLSLGTYEYTNSHENITDRNPVKSD